MTDTAEQQWNTMNEQWKATTEAQKHTAATHRGWSKISTGLKKGLLLKNAQWIFRTTAENRASNTHSDIEHNKHSAQQALKTLLCAVFTFLEQQHSRAVLQTACRAFYSIVLTVIGCGFLTTATQHTAVNMYEQEIRKNCSNAVSR